MDLDAYIQRHSEEWRRLDGLSRKGRLTGEEADHLIDGYQRVSTHLSQVRTSSPDPALVGFLSSVLHHSRLKFASARSMSWEGFLHFFTHTYPAALYRTRRWWGSVLLVCVALATLIGWYVYDRPWVMHSLLSPAEIDQLVNHDFENYYHEYRHESFAFRVWTNNAWVTAQCIAFGVLGFPVVYLLWNNILNLGASAGLMATHGHLDLFFGLILPHGMLELTCVFVAAGVGLRLFWSWIEPGHLTRVASMAAEGRRAMSVVLGLIPTLLVCGLIEGFVTPSGLPTWARIAVGVIAWLGFMAYVYFPGRWAYRAGETGDIDPEAAGASAITVG